MNWAASCWIDFGMVAEKNRVWRFAGSMRTICFSAWMKPRSIIWSASSRTRISTSRRVRCALVDQVDQPARRGDQHVDAARHVLPVLAERGAAEHGGDPMLRELAVSAGAVGDLPGQLARRRQHQHAAGAGRGAAVGGGEPVDRRQHEGRGLAGAGLGDAEQVAALQDRRNGLQLDRGRRVVILRGKRLQKGLREPEGLE